MKFNDESRTRLGFEPTLSRDPAESTVELKVDDEWHTATWQGAAVLQDGEWTKAAVTNDWFAGENHAAPASATVLAVGVHPTRSG